MKTYQDMFRSYHYWTRLLTMAAITAIVMEASFSQMGQVPFSWWLALKLFGFSFAAFVGSNWALALYQSRRLSYMWCRRFHRQHHEQFSTDYAKLYYRCKKCDHHFSKLRP
jgi:hypothetical protein